MTKAEFESAPWFPALTAALAHDGGMHSIDDVFDDIERGDAQLWPGVRSAVVTNIIEKPQGKVLHFFLAGGDLAELEQMTPLILQWAREKGCVRAALIGRRGWERSFLTRTGWSVVPVVHMEVPL